MSRRGGWIIIWGAILGLLTSAAPALAGGGNVLPPMAKPKGYSLAEAAATMAYFNTGPRTPDTLPQGFPFQELYVVPGEASNTFEVKPGTMLYVPVVYADDSPPILPDFPDVNDPEAVSDYYFNPKELGADFIEVVVDGEVTSLGPRYAVGAETPGLLDGGNRYTTAAVFLTPLSKGTHTVTIQARFTGDVIGGVFEFETTYTVNVR